MIYILNFFAWFSGIVTSMFVKDVIDCSPIRTETPAHHKMTNIEQAAALYRDWWNAPTFNRSFRLQALDEFRRSRKKSFTALGLNNRQIVQIKLAMKPP